MEHQFRESQRNQITGVTNFERGECEEPRVSIWWLYKRNYTGHQFREFLNESQYCYLFYCMNSADKGSRLCEQKQSKCTNFFYRHKLLQLESKSAFDPMNRCSAELQLTNSTLEFQNLAALCWTVDAQQNKFLGVADEDEQSATVLSNL